MTPAEGFHSDYVEERAPRFCVACGGVLGLTKLAAEERPRHVCAACGRIHYINPSIVAAVLPVHAGRVLLLRRAIEPRVGTWVFPGGFVEWGETMEEAAAREAAEEVGIEIEVGPVLGVYSRRGPGVVIAVYLGRVRDPSFRPGREALEAAWFTRDEIPWDDLAFDTTEAALRAWADQRTRHEK